MSNDPSSIVARVAADFQISGRFEAAVPYGNGHINETYLATLSENGRAARYVFQRINHKVFREPEMLMDNFRQITSHLTGKIQEAGEVDIKRRVLQPVTSESGACFSYDSSGYLWRATPYIKNTVTYQIVETTEQAFEVGRSFGEFQRHLLDFPADRLHETIHDFHNTRWRFDSFTKALDIDSLNRAKAVSGEITQVAAHESWVDRLVNLQNQGVLPTRIIHNDTKVNNLLVDQQSLKGICVTDLDTTMAGLTLYDFGDMVRTSANTAPEDEKDLGKVNIDIKLFEALVRGYLEAAGEFLTQTELANLVFSGKLITYELAVRFLTDYLVGDQYFKIDYPKHNLDRCRSQLALVRAVEAVEEKLENIVESNVMLATG